MSLLSLPAEFFATNSNNCHLNITSLLNLNSNYNTYAKLLLKYKQ